MIKISILDMSLKIADLTSHPHISGANELRPFIGDRNYKHVSLDSVWLLDRMNATYIDFFKELPHAPTGQFYFYLRFEHG